MSDWKRQFCFQACGYADKLLKVKDCRAWILFQDPCDHKKQIPYFTVEKDGKYRVEFTIQVRLDGKETKVGLGKKDADCPLTWSELCIGKRTTLSWKGDLKKGDKVGIFFPEDNCKKIEFLAVRGCFYRKEEKCKPCDSSSSSTSTAVCPPSTCSSETKEKECCVELKIVVRARGELDDVKVRVLEKPIDCTQTLVY